MVESDFPSALSFVVLLAVLGGLILIFISRRRERLPSEIKLFLIALLLRFATSVLIYEGGLVDIIGDEDAQEWVNGRAVNLLWQKYQVGYGELPLVLAEAYTGETANRGYMYLLAAVYYLWDIGDPGRLVATALNSFAGAMTVVLVYCIAYALFNARVALLAGWLTCLFPSLIVWSAQSIKEPVIILLETTVLYCCIRMAQDGPSLRYLMPAGIAIVVVAPFRFYGAYLVAGILIATLFLRTIAKGAAELRGAFGIGELLGGLLFVAVVAGLIAQQDQQFDLEYLARLKLYSSTAPGSGVDLPFDLETPTGLGMAALVGSIHLLFAPLPWQWTGGSTRLAFTIPEVVVWWILFVVGVWPGFRRALRERFVEIQPIILFLVGFGFMYSLMFGNVGLAYRQRAQLLPCLLIFCAAGLEARWRRHREARAIARLRARTEPIQQVENAPA